MLKQIYQNYSTKIVFAANFRNMFNGILILSNSVSFFLVGIVRKLYI